MKDGALGPSDAVVELLRRYTNDGDPKTWPRVSAKFVEDSIRVIEGKWKMVIVFHLLEKGTLRFGQLERAIEGVTQKMLIQQLRDLERDGVVRRTVFDVVPPRVEYALTELGEKLCPALNELIIWAGARQLVVGD
jgi:DNA-binding HxlR family transcriptional regulator